MDKTQTSIRFSLARFIRRAATGALAGICGGIVIGLFLLSTGAMAAATEKFGGASVEQGFVMHMIFSTLMGAVFGACFGRLIATYRQAISYAVLTGALFWVFGLAVVGPLRFGEPFGIESALATKHILVGHSVFGVIMGAMFVPVQRLLDKLLARNDK